MNKKRILLSNEFSLLNTGFSTMGFDLLTGLKNTNKYEVAELASYVSEDDPKINTLPWKVYPVIPSQNNRKELEQFNQNYREAQFGSQKLEDTILDFKPDVILSHRDFWHNDFVNRSPYRNLFNFAWSACVDSEPPHEKWLDSYSMCDTVSSYTNWGLNVLKNYGGENLNVSNLDTMPGVDLNIFKPLDKTQTRKELSLRTDINVVLTTMRNQPRKLIPNLISSFMNFIDKSYKDGKDDIANKTYLYIHTGYPDVGWDLAKELLRYNAGSRVLFTYVCDHCNHFYASFFNGERCHCPACKKLSCHMANTSKGVTREQLNKIYNIADIFIQYSIAEGLCVPLLESKAAGIPTITVDYAAPYELSNMGGNFGRIPVLAFKQEGIQETGQLRSIPDDDAVVKVYMKYFRLSEDEKKNWSKKARETAEKYHNNVDYINKWSQIIDSLPELNPDRWTAKPNLIPFSYNQIPWNLEPISFVRWCCAVLLPPKHHLTSFLSEKKLLKHLVHGYNTDNGSPFDKRTLIDLMREELNRYNHFELHRYNMLVTKQQVKSKNNLEFKVY